MPKVDSAVSVTQITWVKPTGARESQMGHFTLNEERLFIDGRLVETSFPVAHALQVGDLIVALLDVPYDRICNTNVVCYDLAGGLKWTIRPSPYGGVSDDVFLRMRIDEQERLIAETSMGFHYRVDLATGEIEIVGFHRF